MGVMLDRVIEMIREWISKRKVGSITINFFKGGISSVKIEETIRVPRDA